MLVAELRRKLIEKVEQVATEESEEAAAIVLTHARAILIALAGHPGNEEVSLQELRVGTQTAAVIMGLHREYIRALARAGQLSATKTNGEFQIALSDISNQMLAMSPLMRQSSFHQSMEALTSDDMVVKITARRRDIG